MNCIGKLCTLFDEFVIMVVNVLYLAKKIRSSLLYVRKNIFFLIINLLYRWIPDWTLPECYSWPCTRWSRVPSRSVASRASQWASRSEIEINQVISKNLTFLYVNKWRSKSRFKCNNFSILIMMFSNSNTGSCFTSS